MLSLYFVDCVKIVNVRKDMTLSEKNLYETNHPKSPGLVQFQTQCHLIHVSLWSYGALLASSILLAWLVVDSSPR